MPKKRLLLEEVKVIARGYVFKLEQEACSSDNIAIVTSTPVQPKYVEVEIKGTEPSSVDKDKSLVHGCVRRFVVDLDRDVPCKILVSERIFRLWVSRIDGEISDYLPEQWVTESDRRIDDELKESEIARNRMAQERDRGEIDRLDEEENERLRQEQEDWDSNHFKFDPDKYKIDPNKYRF
jgi:hypothetical protein